MSDQPITPPNLPPVDMNHRVGQYVQLRDLKAEITERHKEELKPITELMEALEGLMQQGLQAVNAESLRTDNGTVTASMKMAASVADMDTFWAHVVTSGNFDLLDKKANLTAVKDYVEKHGVPPPGVNFSTFNKVGVRRPTGK